MNDEMLVHQHAYPMLTNIAFLAVMLRIVSSDSVETIFSWRQRTAWFSLELRRH